MFKSKKKKEKEREKGLGREREREKGGSDWGNASLPPYMGGGGNASLPPFKGEGGGKEERQGKDAFLMSRMSERSDRSKSNDFGFQKNKFVDVVVGVVGCFFLVIIIVCVALTSHS